VQNWPDFTGEQMI